MPRNRPTHRSGRSGRLKSALTAAVKKRLEKYILIKDGISARLFYPRRDRYDKYRIYRISYPYGLLLIYRHGQMANIIIIIIVHNGFYDRVRRIILSIKWIICFVVRKEAITNTDGNNIM
jgi:hypothetical protein